MDDQTKLEGELAEETKAFLEALAEETGVSHEFLMKARPAINLIFTEVPEEGRALCVETVRDIVKNQANTEADIRRIRVGVAQLDASHTEMFNRLSALNKQVKRLATSCAHLEFRIYQPSTRSRMVH